jgi:hypothetical protein
MIVRYMHSRKKEKRNTLNDSYFILCLYIRALFVGYLPHLVLRLLSANPIPLYSFQVGFPASSSHK